jgi:hypothetical protein
MQDRPTAIELLAAVRHFLEQDIMPGLEGRRRFHTLVATNVLSIVERELATEEDSLGAEWKRLSDLLQTGDVPTSLSALRSAVRELTERLTSEIKAGKHDDDAPVRDHLRKTTNEKLAIANPRMLRR